MLDILYSAIHLIKGLQKPELPGLIVLTPPRNSARGRDKDLLYGYLYAPNLPADEYARQEEVLKQAAAQYFKTPGTVTSGMRLVIDKLNSELMIRNLGRGPEGNHISASFSMGVLHHGMLFYTNVGALRSFVITRTETLDSQETELTSRGLGISQNLTPRFQQVEIKANDLVILSPAAPLSWTAASLAGSAELSVEALRRRLSNQAGPELTACLFRFVEGTGKVLPLNLRFAQAEAPMEPSLQTASIKKEEQGEVLPAIPEAQDQVAVPAQPQPEKSHTPASPQLQPVPTDSITFSAQNMVEPSPADGTKESRQARIEPATPAAKKRPHISPGGPSKAGRSAAAVMRWLSGASASVKNWGVKLIGQTLPTEGESSVKLSNATMLTISILVPLLVVAVGASFYDRVGRTQEFNNYLVKAQQYSIQAEAQKSDPAAHLTNLQQAMHWLDMAGRYGSSAEYLALRSQVQSGLDSLNGILRLNFVPALDPALESGVVIRQMVATATDLYLLDDTSGKVLRYFYAGSVFQKDNSFDCGPNASPLGASIGKVVDIAALPSGNSLGATLMAVDGAGTIEYCTPSQAGMVNALIAPDAGWGKLQSITLSQGNLYVLDSAMNAVYTYGGNGTEFPDQPTLFFDEQVPQLGEANDIEVNGDELYILRSNGEMVECTYSPLKELKATECLDPAPYGDMRAGQEPQVVTFPEVKFIQMHMTPAPDSSLYVLDAAGKTIHHFSLQRNLQKVFLPSFENAAIAKLEPSAFAVSPGRLIFVALQHEVQFTQLP